MTPRIDRVVRLLLAVGLSPLLPDVSAAQAPPASPPPARATRPRTVAEDLQLFSQVYNQVRLNHVDSQDSHRLLLQAVAGLIRAADPHSYVVPAERLTDSAEAAAAKRGRIPVPVTFRFVAGVPLIVGVGAGTAAARSDLRLRDALVAIDGAPVQAESEEGLAEDLAGPPRTSVQLTVERERPDGTRVRLVREVKREEPAPESAVAGGFLLAEGTGYVRVTTWVGERIAGDLEKVLDRLEREGMQRLVLDLRDNGGGRVDEASRAAGFFLPAGAVVYTTEGRHKDVIDTGRVRRAFWRSARQVPVAVLVNDGTASASELLAGALQDHDRAVVVGRTTFGKALLMRGMPLLDGSLLWLVVGRLRTPCGRDIQRSYREVRAADYYRLAGADRDTVGRPSCRTAAGRVVYGGGGIVPDVRVGRAPAPPAWLDRLAEDDVLGRWAAAAVSELVPAGATPAGFVAAPPPAARIVESLRAFAAAVSARAAIPDEAAADPAVVRRLLGELAGVRWGDSGIVRVLAPGDPDVMAAIAALRDGAKAP